MVTSGPLDAQLQQIAWSMASHMQLTARPAEPWDEYHDATVEERRAGCLVLMRVYTRMSKVLQRRIDLAVKEALTLDATYGDIATACGISRQAARQRWLRHRERYEPPRVLLSGGPYDGKWECPRPGAELIVTLWEDGPARPSGYARYVPSEENPGIYRFVASNTYDWDAAAPESARPGPPRVYEIAKEFGVESKAVLGKLQEMGEFVSSAASTVKPEALRQLWEHFQAPRIQSPATPT